MQEDYRNIMRIVGTNIRKYRLAMNISQEDFAELCGLHRTYIGAVERAERNLTIRSLSLMARALNVPITELFKDNS